MPRMSIVWIHDLFVLYFVLLCMWFVMLTLSIKFPIFNVSDKSTEHGVDGFMGIFLNLDGFLSYISIYW